jgi:hypothetical protein
MVNNHTITKVCKRTFLKNATFLKSFVQICNKSPSGRDPMGLKEAGCFTITLDRGVIVKHFPCRQPEINCCPKKMLHIYYFLSKYVSNFSKLLSARYLVKDRCRV